MTARPMFARICAAAAGCLLVVSAGCAPPHPRPDVGIRAVTTDVVIGPGTPTGRSDPPVAGTGGPAAPAPTGAAP